MSYINKILDSNSSQSWYEELLDYLVGVTSAPFKCKKRDAIISTTPGFMRGAVVKEINKMEKQLSIATLGEIRRTAKVYNTAYQKMLDSVNDDDISLPEFAIMCQRQIGTMTPMSNIQKGQSVASPEDLAAKVSKKEKNNPDRTPKQRKEAKQAEDAFSRADKAFGVNESKQHESLSDYREKLLEERLQKLTTGLIK